MRSQPGTDLLFATVAKLAQVDAVKKGFARAKYGRDNDDMHFVDQALPKVLPDRIGASADANILFAGSVTSQR
jgi:hypothetical protein